jgi:hypothetical protein
MADRKHGTICQAADRRDCRKGACEGQESGDNNRLPIGIQVIGH